MDKLRHKADRMKTNQLIGETKKMNYLTPRRLGEWETSGVSGSSSWTWSRDANTMSDVKVVEKR